MKNIKLFDWLLTIFAIIQGSAQLVGVFVSENTVATSSLLKIWVSIGNTICDNWLAFSITLVLTALGYFLYRLIYYAPQADNNEKKRRVIITSFLVIINLALCNKIYSTRSLSEKLIFFKSHIAIIIIAVLIILPIIAVTLFFKNERKISEELGKINLESRPMGSIDSINCQNNAADNYNLASFRMQHPISYAIRSMAYYRGNKAKLKQDIEKNRIQLKTEFDKKKYNKKIKKLQQDTKKIKKHQQDTKKSIMSKAMQISANIFSTILSLAITGTLTYILMSKDIIEEIFNSPDSFIEKLKNLYQSSSAIYQLLLTLAIVFSFVIVCFALYLIVYIIIRMALYIIFKSGEDESILLRCTRMIKVFVFNSFDGAMRLLLFIPDFIEEVESVLLDTDIDEKIQKLYPPKDDDNMNKS